MIFQTNQSETEKKAWKTLNKSLGGAIWTNCDMCKAFVCGTAIGFAVCFLVIAIL